MLNSLRAANLALAFVVELGMLAAFALAGWAATETMWLRFLLAIGFPALAILLWAVWAAPKAGKRRLKPAPLILFKFLIFGFATAGLWAAGQYYWAAVFGTLAALNLIGIVAFRQY